MIGFNKDLTQFKFAYSKDIKPFLPQDEAILIKNLKLLNWFQKIEIYNICTSEYPE